jgi:hypothetical protein
MIFRSVRADVAIPDVPAERIRELRFVDAVPKSPSGTVLLAGIALAGSGTLTLGMR